MFITDEMRLYSKERNKEHRSLVKEFFERLENSGWKHLTVGINIEDHDWDKENILDLIDPYVLINWKYKMEKEGETLPELPGMKEATFTHITQNLHHPEFWDSEVTMFEGDRDDPNRPIVVSTLMPPSCIVEMVCDWSAVSKERGESSPKEWADKNIGSRWKFSEIQTDLIYRLIDYLWGE